MFNITIRFTNNKKEVKNKGIFMSEGFPVPNDCGVGPDTLFASIIRVLGNCEIYEYRKMYYVVYDSEVWSILSGNVISSNTQTVTLNKSQVTHERLREKGYNLYKK